MPKPPRPPPRPVPPKEQRLVISPHVTVQWIEGALRVTPQEGQEIESRDPTMLWLLHEFATPKLPRQVAGSLPGTPAASLETAIADLQATGILVAEPLAAKDHAAGRRSAGADAKQGRKPIPGKEHAQLTASVILPTRNKARLLDYTLASYLCQTDERFELVIIDDGSSDETAEIIKAYDGRLFVRALHRARLGPTAARNVGLREAEGDIVIFADDATIVGPSFIAQHLAAYDSAQEMRWVIGWQRGIVTLLDRALLGSMYPVVMQRLRAEVEHTGPALALFEPADLTERFDETVAEHGTDEPNWQQRVAPAIEEFGVELQGLEVGWFLGGAATVSAPRSAVQEVDLLDDHYPTADIAAVDLCYALTRAGAGVDLARDALSFRQVEPPRRPGRERRRALRYFLRKHDRLEARLFLWWWLGDVDISTANRIAQAAKGGRGATDPVLAALDRAITELLTSRLS